MRALLLELTECDYLQAIEIQRSMVAKKISTGGPDVLILLEHPPTVTLGTRGRESHLLMSREELAHRGVAVHVVDRGGEATYHGPGQLVCYPIVDLRSRGCSIRDYVSLLEETIIGALALFGVTAFRRPGRAGVWTGMTDKIASVGVRVRQRVTSHGFSLNVAMTVDPGELIISCGMSEIRMVNLNELVEVPVTMEAVRAAVTQSFAGVFQATLVPLPLDRMMEPA